MIKILKQIALLALIVCVGFSCKKDEMLTQGASISNEYKYELKGEVVNLELTASTEEAFRALSYSTTSTGLPKLELPIAGEKVDVLVMLRKLGDPSSLTYIKQKWTVQPDGKTLKYTGEVQLANGDFLTSESGKWYIMAALGFTSLDVDSQIASGEVTLAHHASRLHRVTQSGKLEMSVPYLMPWTPLEIAKESHAKHAELKLYPQGSIFSYRVRNNMVDNYNVHALRVASNVVYNDALCDISPSSITDESLQGTITLNRPSGTRIVAGQLPPWRSKVSSVGKYELDLTIDYVDHFNVRSDDSGPWSFSVLPLDEENLPDFKQSNRPGYYYTNYILDEPLFVASGKEAEPLYGWVMPVEGADNPETEVYVDASDADFPASRRGTLPGLRSAQIPKEGTYYRVSPMITSDLIVSEVALHWQDASADGSGAGTPVAPGVPDAANLSLIELYNPTLEPIDLTDFAITRGTKQYMRSGLNVFYAGMMNTRIWEGKTTTYHAGSTRIARILPLYFLVAEPGKSIYQNSKFSDWTTLPAESPYTYVASEGAYGTTAMFDGELRPVTRRVVLAGETPKLTDGKLLLMPGKTVLLGAGGWLRHDDAVDLALKNTILTKIREAVALGHCQFAVAYTDTESDWSAYGPVDQPYLDGDAGGTLDMANDTGFTLIKKVGNVYIEADTNQDIALHQAETYYASEESHMLWQALVEDDEYRRARYGLPGSTRFSTETQLLTSRSIGYTRHPGENHSTTLPFIFRRYERYYTPFDQFWPAIEGTAYSYGKRSAQVTGPYVAPAKPQWSK